jgi:D-alanyl-D-alanine carboxypeptidase/D-alanyl-D-alanine-endopeptidase (penicillin-binding protein 4)
MKSRVITFMLAVALCPLEASDLNTVSPTVALTPPTQEKLASAALTRALAKLERRRYRSYNQGILVETLDGSKSLAQSNADISYNPASVMKLATSFAALATLGAEHRFETSVYGDSPLNTKSKSLTGNLYLISDGNPVFGAKDATALSRSLVRRGLRVVAGDLVVVGPFCLDDRYTTQKSAEELRRFLTRSGISIKGKVRSASLSPTEFRSKILYLSQTSRPLRDILWEQNAHSVNEIADRLGRLLGGASAVQQFLIDNARIDPQDIYVDRPSGLEYNRMTPRAAIKILRELYYWLEEHQMKMQEIMPVAGLDEGTLFGRFRDSDFRGCVLGKTGTNPSKDGGVSALAGVAFTRDYGPILYAIFNSHGSVTAYRRWQDNFLKDLIEECGGLGDFLSPHEDLAGLDVWTASTYWESLAQEREQRPVVRKAKSSSPRKYVRSRRSLSRRRV